MDQTQLRRDSRQKWWTIHVDFLADAPFRPKYQITPSVSPIERRLQIHERKDNRFVKASL